jgi:2-polyprenyl-3-methyl-5-hydroxy-6-metoxy-1,4-benzoquinol methylase
MRERKIGKAEFIDLQNDVANTYSDGSIEDELLDLFKSTSPDIDAFMKEHSDWATTYHLSPVRTNLLNWYDFEPGASLLEVGAGCGALTGLFASRCDAVTALELSPRRAEINVRRNKTHENLKVVAGNLEDLDGYSNQKYDYVVCVGVLEYAGRFISGSQPFDDFIGLLKDHLKPGGTVILAIENKLGLKYFAGSSEDHVQRPLEGIEGYPHYDGIRTFGKAELTRLFKANGLAHTHFYYPMPDYKMPHTVYSDAYLPGIHTDNIPSEFFPTPHPDQPREQIFREQLAIRSISENDLFADLANSFLVTAKSKAFTKAETSCIYAHGSVNRLPAYRTITRLVKHDKELEIEKMPFDSRAKGHISRLGSKSKKLTRLFPAGNSIINISEFLGQQKDIARFHFTDGRSLQNDLMANIIAGNNENCFAIVDMFIEVLNNFPSKTIVPSEQSGLREILGSGFTKSEECISPGVVDLNFDNIIYNSTTETYEIIDYEWLYDFAIPKNYLIARAMSYFFRRHNQIIRATTSPARPAYQLTDDLIIPLEIYERYSGYFAQLKLYDEAESKFQMAIVGKASKRHPIRRRLIDTELPDNTVDAYRNLQIQHRQIVDALRKDVEELRTRFAVIQKNVDRVSGSTPWKVASRLNRLRRRIR